MILGFEHHRASDRQHLLLAPGQGAAGLVAPLGQHREKRVGLVEERLFAFLADAVAVEPGAQILDHRQQAEDPSLLGHIADPETRQPVRR